MRLPTLSVVLAVIFHGSLAAIPDLVTNDITTISTNTLNFEQTSAALPESGDVDKSLVLHWDNSALALYNSIHTAFLDTLNLSSNGTLLTDDETNTVFESLIPFRESTLDLLTQLKSKIAFRASYSPTALADLSKLRDSTHDYFLVLQWLPNYPANQVLYNISDPIAAAYDSTIRFFNYQT